MTVPANLLQWAGYGVQTPICRVLINGTKIDNAVSVDVDFGYDQKSSSAQIRVVADDYLPWQEKATVEIYYGYAGQNGGDQLCFRGELEDIDTKFLPYFIDLKAAGYLKRAQRQAGSNPDNLTFPETAPVLTWENVTDSDIWNDIMSLAGIANHSAGTGDGRTIAGPIDLMPTENLSGIVDALDAASESGQRTFEFTGTVYRRPALRVPSGTPAWKYTEGTPDLTTTPPTMPLHSLGRSHTDRDVKNQAIVSGRVDPGIDTGSDAVVTFTNYAVEQAYSPYWGNDRNGNPIYVPTRLDNSPYLETREQCTAVAQRYMYENNKITDKLSMRTALNPYAFPARTVGITSRRLGLVTSTNYWVVHVHHHWGSEGATTDWTLEGGAGVTGYLVGLPPIALFTVKATKETWLEGIYETPTTYYTVVADASTSYDLDGTIVGYAWSNNKNSDTGGGVLYTTKFTQAEWDDADIPPTITLVVTDSDTPTPHTDANTQDVLSAVSDDVKVIAMYVAAYGIAEATPDGWETVNTWTPGAGHVVSVCRIGAEGTNYFGLDNGHVYSTADYLASAPTNVWAAPGGSAVNALWLSETDSNIVGMGLANGDFYITRDAFATAPVKLYSFVNPITWIEGSFQNVHQWRVAVGQDIWFTNDDFANVRVLVAFAGLVGVQTELTNFANYASARGVAGDVLLKREGDGFPLTFPVLVPAPAEIHMTAFIDTDTLLVGDDQGRVFLSEPASAATALTQATPVGEGFVHDLLRDNTNYAAAYAATQTSVSKTFDRAATWHKVRSYNGVAFIGLQLGYDSAPLVPPVVFDANYIERVSANSGAPDPVLDDLGNGLVHAMCLWVPGPIVDGAGTSANDDPPLNWYRTDYVETPFNTHEWTTATSALTGGNRPRFMRANDVWSDVGRVGQTRPPVGAHLLFRHVFKLPVGVAGGKVLIEFYVRGQQIRMGYINNTSIELTSGYIYDLSTFPWVCDGVTDNLFAVDAYSIPSNLTLGEGRVQWKLTFNKNTDFVSVSKLDDGTIRIVSTTAEADSSFNINPLPAGWANAIDPTVSPWTGLVRPQASYSRADNAGNAVTGPPYVTVAGHSSNWAGIDLPIGVPGGPIEGSYYIQPFKLPAGSFSTATLIFRVPYNEPITSLFINGTALTLPAPTGDINSGSVYTLDVPVSLLVEGWNKLACKSIYMLRVGFALDVK